jgi:hypothetical protein
MDLSLNKFSAEVARTLFAEYPDWKRFATATDGFLYVGVPSPAPASSEKLQVRTEDNELTVSFDGWHSHFGFPNGPLLEWGLDLIRELISEHVIIVVEGEKHAYTVPSQGEPVILKRRLLYAILARYF